MGMTKKTQKMKTVSEEWMDEYAAEGSKLWFTKFYKLMAQSAGSAIPIIIVIGQTWSRKITLLPVKN